MVPFIHLDLKECGYTMRKIENGIILHYNRGCEGLSTGIAENRPGLLERGLKVMAYEGNMGDEREFDEQATLNRFDIFLESLGLKNRNISIIRGNVSWIPAKAEIQKSGIPRRLPRFIE